MTKPEGERRHKWFIAKPKDAWKRAKRRKKIREQVIKSRNENVNVESFLKNMLPMVDGFMKGEYTPEEGFVILFDNIQERHTPESDRKEILQKVYAHLGVSVPKEPSPEEVETVLLSRAAPGEESVDRAEIDDVNRKVTLITRIPVSPAFEIHRQISYEWFDEHFGLYKSGTRHILVRSREA